MQSKISLKILLFAPASSAHTLRWAKSLDERGHRITIISRQKPGVDEYPAGIKLYYPAHLGAKSWTSLLYCVFIGIWKKMTWAPDVVHGHFLTSYGNIASLCSRKYIVSVWGNDIYTLHRRFKTVQYKSIGTLSKAKYILSTSNIMAQKTKEYVEREVLVTPFGVDTSVFMPQKERSSDKFTIGCVKWLDEKYGISDILKAFRILVVEKKVPNIRLVLTGGGPRVDYYKGMAEGLGIANHVEFMGHVPFKMIDKIHKQLDIAVYPSDSESFGVSVLESSACGVPVVVSNVGGLPEVVVQNETGIIINPRDPNAIAQTLYTLIEDAALRARLGANGRRFVEDKYSWDKCVDLMESIYLKHALET